MYGSPGAGACHRHSSPSLTHIAHFGELFGSVSGSFLVAVSVHRTFRVFEVKQPECMLLMSEARAWQSAYHRVNGVLKMAAALQSQRP